MTQNTQNKTTVTDAADISKQSLPAAVPVPAVTPIEQLGDVLLLIQSDARKAPQNYLSDLHATYGGE
jgi:hypothetical protein